MGSRLIPTTIAVLSQTTYTIGLFDVYEITPETEERVVWIRARIYTDGVQPQALLSLDNNAYYTQQASVRVFTNTQLTLLPSGHIDPQHLFEAMFIRLPYNVTLYTLGNRYPLFSVSPDTLLPWSTTQTAGSRILFLNNIEYRHSGLQSNPSMPIVPGNFYTPLFSPSSEETRVPVAPVPPTRSLSSMDACPITLETLTTATAYWTPCGHVFSGAIERALKGDPRCPLCRAPCLFSECYHS